MRFRTLALVALYGSALAFATGAELRNPSLSLELGTARQGTPAITKATWTRSGATVFTGRSPEEALGAWRDRAEWTVHQGEVFHRAEASRQLASGVRATWVVELATAGALLRLHIRMTNAAKSPQRVEWFPAWAADWGVEPAPRWLRAWESLSFRQVERAALGSRLHSSEDKGANPYWVIGGGATRFYFGLEWCGGWEAALEGGRDRIAFQVRLPAPETQLVLSPGESIDGPALIVVPVAETGDAAARRSYMAQRARLAGQLYGGPTPSYLLSFNHWYATGFAVNAAVLKRQIDAVAPYGFDAFVIDAGWYDKVGRWVPDPAKFAPGEFEEMLRGLKSRGITPGIWTCPQFVNVPPGEVRPDVDQPGFYEKFIQGSLLDLAGSGWTARLVEHVAELRARYSTRWWKYDQRLFVPETRAGVMKNVVAFQKALLAVRKANPDLIIENCQSGGRMINELTVLADQQQWLRDGGTTGLKHARGNIAEALGAMEFVFPWAALRWTNNPDRMDPTADELLRFYSRSAMAGSWGISADLTKIAPRQQAIILQEIRHYRRLNRVRTGSLLYDIDAPRQGAETARVTFYDRQSRKAGILLYRWDREGAFEVPVPLRHLRKESRYRVEDVDTGTLTRRSGDELARGGLAVRLDPQRMSALLFVEAE